MFRKREETDTTSKSRPGREGSLARRSEAGKESELTQNLRPDEGRSDAERPGSGSTTTLFRAERQESWEGKSAGAGEMSHPLPVSADPKGEPGEPTGLAGQFRPSGRMQEPEAAPRRAEIQDVTSQRARWGSPDVDTADWAELNETSMRGRFHGEPFNVEIQEDGGFSFISFDVNLNGEGGESFRILGRRRLARPGLDDRSSRNRGGSQGEEEAGADATHGLRRLYGERRL